MSKESKKPSRISLDVDHSFPASHSLEGFEVPHFHLWKVSVRFEAALPLANDRLIDLMFLQGVMEKIVTPIRGTFLNHSFPESPTSENMALWFWDKILIELPEAPLQEVRVWLCDLQGVSTGSARVIK